MSFFSHDAARAAGWFSRRYRSPETHHLASAANAARWATKREAEEYRRAVRARRTSAQQLAALDDLLGSHQGAVRERARLTAKASLAATRAKRSGNLLQGSAR